MIVGSKYTYVTTSYFPPVYLIFRASITKDTFIYGKKYFYCQSFPFVGTGWVRFDTATGNLLKHTTTGGCSIYPNDIILDSMKSKPNNQINCTYLVFMLRRCLDTVNMNIFNQFQRKTIYFLNDGLIYGQTRFARDFGIVYDCTGEPPPCSGFTNLKGCVINGIVYGDTTMTILKNITSKIPDKFSLSQNYPNPFNPSTKIRFNIPSNLSFPSPGNALSPGSGGDLITLKIYNILGKEIATLVNEKLKPGEYEITFDGSNLPSGIYFYTLSADNFKKTKKMALIK